MTLLDLLVIVLVGSSVAAGIVSGFARVGIGFLAAVCGVLFGFWFYGIPAAWIHKSVHSAAASNLIAFFVIFVACLLAGSAIALLFSKFFKLTGLTWLDRLMGGVFGLVRGALIVVALVAVLMAFIPKPMPNWIVNSVSLPYAIDGSNVLSKAAPQGIKDTFRDAMLEIRQTWREQLRNARKELEPGKRERAKEKDKKDKDDARKKGSA